MKKLTALLLTFFSVVIYGQNPKKITNIPGIPNSAFFSWTCNGLQFYQDYVAATNNTQIWRTDGTANGTFPVTNFSAGTGLVLSSTQTAAVVGNIFYFSFNRVGAPGYEIWKTDGTVSGTSQLNIAPVAIQTGYVLANSTHLFFASYPYEDLYSIDNSGQVTYLAQLKNPGVYHSLTEGHAAVFRDKLIVTKAEFNNQGNPTGLTNLFITDGTVAGSNTQQTLLSSLPRNMIPCGDNFLLLLLPTSPVSLGKLPGISNGGVGNLEIFYTGTGANDLKNYNHHYSSTVQTNGIETFSGNATIGNSILLSGYSDNHGWELWKTDGSAAGTTLVKDIYTGSGSGFDRYNGFVVNGKFIFDAYTLVNGNGRRMIFYSDGTNAGTDFFLQRPPSNDPNQSLTNVIYADDKAYFRSLDNSGISSLWQTDGSIENTLPVTPYALSLDAQYIPFGKVASGNIIYKSGNYIMSLNPNYKLWNGSTNGDWTSSSNWENEVTPGFADSVLIPASAPNYPVLNTTVNINSMWLNSYNATITNNAVLTVNGELGVSENNTLNGNGSVNFSGTGNHVFDGVGTIDLPITLSGNNVTISGGNKTIPQLNFQSAAKLFLENNDLTISQDAGITGYANDRFIVTNGNGRLILPAIGTAASSTSAIFPVGSSANSYTPATVTNNGTSQQFSVRTIEGLYNSYNITYPESPTMAYPNSAVNKTWFINKQNSGQIVNATVLLQWNSGDELSGFNRSAIQLAHYSSGVWITGPSGAASGSGPYTYSRTGLSSFSPFGIANTNLALPVNLLSFTGAYNNKKIKLQWQTSSEQNTSHFIIERSSNSVDFIPIGRKEMTGTSNTTIFYEYTDIYPITSTVFYRLKMYDLDNKYKLSSIISVKSSGVKNIEIFPNPAEHNLQIQLSSEFKGIVILRLLDITGRILHTQFLQKNANNIGTSLDITNLTSGLYLLSVESGAGSKELVRFIKH